MPKPSTAFVAAGSTIASLTSLSAVVIVNTNGFSVSSSGAGSTSFSWDIDGDSFADMFIQTYYSYGYAIDFYSEEIPIVSIVSNGAYSILNLSTGYVIDGGNSFRGLSIISAFPEAAAGFTDGVAGIMGFRFDNGSGTVRYGWADVTYTSATNELTVTQWAYNDSGSSILAGPIAIPEPGTTAIGIGLLTLGAAGVRRWKKQKKAAQI